jgi:hypothetical protein
MLQHIKTFWKRYVVSAVVIPSAFAAGVEVGSPTIKTTVELPDLGYPVRIQVLTKDIPVQVNGQTIKYNDAFYFSPEETAALDKEQMQAKVDERVNNWKTIVETQSTQVATKPTKEQLAESKAQLEAQLQELNAQIDVK